MPSLFTPLTMGSLQLPNRIIMAPLTRVRAGPSHVANDLMAEYYAQRASAGLIFTECSMIADDGSAFMGEGGIFNEATVAGWRQVTDAVHAKGGRIAMQIWHPGRAAHSAINGVQPISSSNKAIRNDVTHTPKGPLPYEVPRPLTLNEIPTVIAQFVSAATRAQAAGFDAVQIHAAHGYLVDQFLRDSVNDRSDRYGGSIENRARLLLEIVDAVSNAIGAGRVGVRISPLVAFNDMSDSNPETLVTYLAQQLSIRQIGHLEMRFEQHDLPAEQVLGRIARQYFSGCLLVNGGYTQASGEAAITDGSADAVVYGKAFIANADLVERFASGPNAPLNSVNFGRLYGGGGDGYTDYPLMSA